jgi:multiple sugar transport system ATP-binding protein
MSRQPAPATAVSGVRVRGLGVRYGEQDVIAGLDLDVQAGEFLVLLGPSGCGKSTLLHSIAGLLDTVAGRIDIDGQEMTFADPSARGIGMVFQSYALYPNMTVLGNLSFGLRVAGVARAEIDRRVQQTAEMLQLGPLLARKPSQLSGGQRQRVAIGRALVRQAGVYLLDEPLSNLDAQLRSELRRELKLLHRALGATMIYVTHDQVEAMTLATRIAVMRQGVIQQIGTPQEVYERPANRFVAGFVGSPAMNFVEGTLAASNGGADFRSPALDLHFAGMSASPGAAVLGVRPEQVRIDAAGRFNGTVQLIEPMGGQQVVWLQCGRQALAAVVHHVAGLALDQVVRFQIDAASVSLFDAASGASIPQARGVP